MTPSEVFSVASTKENANPKKKTNRISSSSAPPGTPMSRLALRNRATAAITALANNQAQNVSAEEPSIEGETTAELLKGPQVKRPLKRRVRKGKGNFNSPLTFSFWHLLL